MFDPMNRADVKRISEEIIRQLQGLAQRDGIEIRSAGGTFGPGEFKMRISIRTKDSGAQQWREYAPGCGFKAEDFGKSFTMGGREYTICGFAPSARKCVLASRAGKVYKFDPFDVRRLMQPALLRKDQEVATCASS